MKVFLVVIMYMINTSGGLDMEIKELPMKLDTCNELAESIANRPMETGVNVDAYCFGVEVYR